MQTQTKRALVSGGLLIFFGAMGLVESFAEFNEWVWVALLVAAGLAVFGVYLTDPTDWVLLIPAYVPLVVAGLIALVTVNFLGDEAIAVYVLTAIALPFLVVFLRDRAKWWALIPAYVLMAVGFMVGLIGAGVLQDLLIPSYIMFAIAIPFLVVYVRTPDQRWPLIPATVLSIIGVSFLVAGAAIEYILPVGLILAGILIVARQFVGRDRGAHAGASSTAPETSSDGVPATTDTTDQSTDYADRDG